MEYFENKGTRLEAKCNNDTQTVIFSLFNSSDVLISSVTMPYPRHDWEAPVTSPNSIFNKPIITTKRMFEIFNIDYAYNRGVIGNAMYFSMFKDYDGKIDIVLDTDKVVPLAYLGDVTISDDEVTHMNAMYTKIYDVSKANNRLRKII